MFRVSKRDPQRDHLRVLQKVSSVQGFGKGSSKGSVRVLYKVFSV